MELASSVLPYIVQIYHRSTWRIVEVAKVIWHHGGGDLGVAISAQAGVLGGAAHRIVPALLHLAMPPDGRRCIMVGSQSTHHCLLLVQVARKRAVRALSKDLWVEDRTLRRIWAHLILRAHHGGKDRNIFEIKGFLFVDEAWARSRVGAEVRRIHERGQCGRVNEIFSKRISPFWSRWWWASRYSHVLMKDPTHDPFILRSQSSDFRQPVSFALKELRNGKQLSYPMKGNLVVWSPWRRDEFTFADFGTPGNGNLPSSLNSCITQLVLCPLGALPL